jgi:hypothetical protein
MLRGRLVIKNASLLIAITLIVVFIGSTSCSVGGETGLGIYLIDNGELVLSEKHIKVYYGDNHTIKLNEEGIKQWNSFIDYEAIPKLKTTLHSRDFVLKINGKEIYQGKFYSSVSSLSYSGIVIMDALITLDGNNNTIRIEFGYPWTPSDVEEDPRDSPEVLDLLEKEGLLK